MTAVELKSEINKALNDVPESVLTAVLDLLNEMKLQSLNDPKFSSHLKRILIEDRELLQKLAE